MSKKKNVLSFTCGQCKREIEPLLLYDGTLCCPRCHKDLFGGIVLNVKDEDGYFALSQECFALYLLSEDDKEKQDYLENAIAFCRKSAYNGNIYALLNLGYYYSIGYDESVHPEMLRAFAKKCYDLVATSHIEEVRNMAIANSQAISVAQTDASASLGTEYIKALCTRLQEGMSRGSRIPRLGVFYVGKEDNAEEVVKALRGLAQACGGDGTLFVAQDNNKMQIAKVASINESNCRGRFWGYRNRNYRTNRQSKERRDVKHEVENMTEVAQCLSTITAVLRKNEMYATDFYDDDIIISIHKYRKLRKNANINSALDVLHNGFLKFRQS